MARKPYVLMVVGDQEYRLKITASAAMDLESRLKKSLFDAVGELKNITVQVTFLWAALQKFHHGMSLQDAANLYDDFLDSEHGGFEKFTELLLDLLELMGFTQAEKTEQKTGKAASPTKQ